MALSVGAAMRVWCIRGEGIPGGVRDEWGFRGVVWYFELDPHTLDIRKTPAQRVQRDRPRKPANLPELTPAQLDEALRETLRLMPLTAEHRATLEARGYDLAACGPTSRHVFASLPADPAARYGVVAAIMARCIWADHAHTWAVPGIELGDARRREGDTLAFLPMVKGTALLELRRDAAGRLWSYEYAPDYAPDAPSGPKRPKRPKRLWPSGQRVDRCHVARPRQDAGQYVLLAEGGHKANLLADAYSAPALACLGKGNWRRFEAALEELDPARERLAVVALDHDAWDGIGREERALVQALMVARRPVAVMRWDASSGAKGPDDALAAGLALTIKPPVEVSEDLRRKLDRQPRADRRVSQLHPWQRATETPEDRAATLGAIARQIAATVREHLTSCDAAERSAVQVITAAPGTGKTHSVSELGAPSTIGDELNTAWIAQRRAMRTEGALSLWRHIEPPKSARDCPNWQLHQALGEKGHNTTAAHMERGNDGRQRPHDCAYMRQFNASCSAIYQLPYVTTSHPVKHDGVVIDELDLAAWLPSRQVTLRALQRAMTDAVDSYADLLLGGLQAVLVDAQADAQAQRPALHGRALFEALNTRMDGRLDEALAAIAQTPPDARPWFTMLEGETPDEAAARALAGPDTTYARVALAFIAELLNWRKGGEWNSQLALERAAAGAAHAGEWALAITERLTFTPGDGKPLPPITLLDATADAELLALLFEQPVRLEPAEIPAPPPHTRHIAVRTGKRYGKRALTGWGAKGLDTAAREVAYLLKELDPDGAKRRAGLVGLITFAGAERDLAERLSIPYVAPEDRGTDDRNRALHFWGARGSNDLEACEVLVIVGTPTLPEHELYRMARAIWANDAPIIEGARKADKEDGGRLIYADPRAQRLADYLTESELAQCAHRIRPLRHDGRVVISFAVAGDLAYLPATTTIECLPHLTASAEDRTAAKVRADAQRLKAAAAELRASGAAVNVRTLAAASGVRFSVAGAWLKVNRAEMAPQSQNTSGLAHISVTLPDSLIESYKQSGQHNGNTPEAASVTAPPRSPQTAPYAPLAPSIAPANAQQRPAYAPSDRPADAQRFPAFAPSLSSYRAPDSVADVRSASA